MMVEMDCCADSQADSPVESRHKAETREHSVDGTTAGIYQVSYTTTR